MRLYLVRDGENQDTIFEISGVIKFGSPLDISDVVLECRGVAFPASGHYAMKLDIGGEFVIERRIEAKTAIVERNEE